VTFVQIKQRLAEIDFDLQRLEPITSNGAKIRTLRKEREGLITRLKRNFPDDSGK
jgi:hypothetical protein